MHGRLPWETPRRCLRLCTTTSPTRVLELVFLLLPLRSTWFVRRAHASAGAASLLTTASSGASYRRRPLRSQWAYARVVIWEKRRLDNRELRNKEIKIIQKFWNRKYNFIPNGPLVPVPVTNRDQRSSSRCTCPRSRGGPLVPARKQPGLKPLVPHG
jgi:hypothetical protein